MAMIAVSCPDCRGPQVVKAGTQPNGTPRYRCQNPPCPRTLFQLAYVALGRRPETQRQIVEMALNGSGIRDTARVLQISPVTLLQVLKKRGGLTPITTAALATLTSTDTDARLARVEAAEVDEMWSSVGKKQAPR